MINHLERGYFSEYGKSLETIKRVDIRLKRIRETGYFKGKNNLDIYYEAYMLEC